MGSHKGRIGGGADAPSLRPVSGRPPLGLYLKDIWDRRFFINEEAKAKAFSGSRNMVLGNAWLLLSPLLDAAVYGLIFGVILRTSRGVEHFIPFLFIGVTFFSLTTKFLVGGAGLIQVRKNFIKAFAFPRATVVLSHALRYFYDFLPVLLMTLLAIVTFPQRVTPYWTWLWLPVILACQLLFGTGLMFLSAYLTHRIPDIKNLITYLSRLWFYCSGVFFAIDKMVEHQTALAFWIRANPMYRFLHAYRDVLLYRHPLDMATLGLLLAWGAGVFILGFVVFWTREVAYSRG